MHYHGSVVLIKISPLHHDESFHSSLLLFLFDWLLKRWEITKVVLIKLTASSYYVTQVAKCASGQMHVNMIISEWIWLLVSQPLKLLSAMLISPCSDWNHKLRTSHGDFMYAFLGCYFGNTAAVKIGTRQIVTRHVRCYIIFTMYWFKSRTMRFTTFYVWTN